MQSEGPVICWSYPLSKRTRDREDRRTRRERTCQRSCIPKCQEFPACESSHCHSTLPLLISAVWVLRTKGLGNTLSPCLIRSASGDVLTLTLGLVCWRASEGYSDSSCHHHNSLYRLQIQVMFLLTGLKFEVAVASDFPLRQTSLQQV